MIGHAALIWISTYPELSQNGIKDHSSVLAVPFSVAAATGQSIARAGLPSIAQPTPNATSRHRAIEALSSRRKLP
jgi:hypothetical protein